MAKGIGYCPFCDTPILVIKNGKPTQRPTGAYRSTKYQMASGTAVTVCMCITCQDSLPEIPDKNFYDTLADYYDACFPPEWEPERCERYKNNIYEWKIDRVLEKQGPVKAHESHGVRIWN